MKYLHKISISMNEPERKQLDRRVRRDLQKQPGSGAENLNVEKSSGPGLKQKLDTKRQIVFSEMIGEEFKTNFNFILEDLKSLGYENIKHNNIIIREIMSRIYENPNDVKNIINNMLPRFKPVYKDELAKIANKINEENKRLYNKRRQIVDEITEIANTSKVATIDEHNIDMFFDVDNDINKFKDILTEYWESKEYGIYSKSQWDFFSGFTFKFNELVKKFNTALANLENAVLRLSNTVKTRIEYSEIENNIKNAVDIKEANDHILQMLANYPAEITVDEITKQINLLNRTMEVQLEIREGDYNRGDADRRLKGTE